jgi:circadian clock protein KaiB
VKHVSTSEETKASFEQALRAGKKEHYVLRLYIAGLTPRSTAAIESVKRLCEEYLHDRYELEIIDVYHQPTLAKGEQIIAAPTLIKKLPLPLRLKGLLCTRMAVFVHCSLSQPMKCWAIPFSNL